MNNNMIRMNQGMEQLNSGMNLVNEGMTQFGNRAQEIDRNMFSLKHLFVSGFVS
jgi:hypothetical protein